MDWNAFSLGAAGGITLLIIVGLVAGLIHDSHKARKQVQDRVNERLGIIESEMATYLFGDRGVISRVYELEQKLAPTKPCCKKKP